MTVRLLLDEHYGAAIAAALRERGRDVVASVADPGLRGEPDAELYRHAAVDKRRIVTENIKDFRPLLMQAHASGTPIAPLLLVPPSRFPRGAGRRTIALIEALDAWLNRPDAAQRPDEDWLV